MTLRRIHLPHPRPRACEHPYRRPVGTAAVCMECGTACSKFGRI